MAVSGTWQGETPQSLAAPAFAGFSPVAENGSKAVLTTGMTTDRKNFIFSARRGIMAEIEYPGIAKLVSRLVWDQETVRSSRTTRTNEKRDSEIADFRVPFPCSMSTVMLDLNPSNSTGLGSSPGQIQEHHVLLHSTSERH